MTLTIALVHANSLELKNRHNFCFYSVFHSFNRRSCTPYFTSRPFQAHVNDM
uniref:Uncharacterized protein n=1 Tax=Rhizophora mucronata TaxID=61149 RepID=A0A2P2IST0_RHIMU